MPTGGTIHLLGWVLLSVGLAGTQDPGPGAGHNTEKELETLKRVPTPRF